MNWTQITLGVAVIILSWYAMMAVHEAGHCLGAVVTGAQIETVEIPIFGFSHTDFSESRQPLLVVWAGPLFGVTAPLILLPLLGRVGCRLGHVLLFFAGFCLLANGAYIGVGAFLRAGDCRELILHGSPVGLLIGFGLVSSAVGLYIWHRMGPLSKWFVAEEHKALGS